MTRLIKKPVGGEARIAVDPRSLVSLERWRAERDALPADVGVVLPNDTAPEAIGPGELDSLRLLAIEFPKYTDGRGYSLARLLRERLGYSGELRAVGNVLHDQLLYMSRCGFDAFQLEAGKDLEGALRAFDALTVRYQPATDEPQPLWRRARLSSWDANAAAAAPGDPPPSL